MNAATDKSTTWKEVTQSEGFKQADPETRKIVRDKFFDQVIRPKAPEGKVEYMRDKFVSTTEPDVFPSQEAGDEGGDEGAGEPRGLSLPDASYTGGRPQERAVKERQDRQQRQARTDLRESSELDTAALQSAQDVADEPEGISASDYGLETLEGGVRGTGGVGGGAGDFLEMGGEQVDRGLRKLGLGELIDRGDEALQGRKPSDLFQRFEDWMNEGAEQIDAQQSQEFSEAVKGSMPKGDLTDPSSWSMGDDPSAAGYMGLMAGLMGEFAPQAATLMAGSPQRAMAAMSAVGGLQAGGGQAREAEEYVETMDHDQLYEEAGLYKELVDGGMDPDEAKRQTAKTAGAAASTAGMALGGAGGAAMGYVLGPLQKRLGGNIVKRVAQSAGIEGAIEGGQEATETMAARGLSNQAIDAARDVTKGTWGDFMTGTMLGGPIGGLGGVGGAARGGKPPRTQSDIVRERTPEDIAALNERFEQEQARDARQAARQRRQDDDAPDTTVTVGGDPVEGLAMDEAPVSDSRRRFLDTVSSLAGDMEDGATMPDFDGEGQLTVRKDRRDDGTETLRVERDNGEPAFEFERDGDAWRPVGVSAGEAVSGEAMAASQNVIQALNGTSAQATDLLRTPRSELDAEQRAQRDSLAFGDTFKTIREQAEAQGMDDVVRDLDAASEEVSAALEDETLARTNEDQEGVEAARTRLSSAAERFGSALERMESAETGARMDTEAATGETEGEVGRRFRSRQEWEQAWQQQGVEDPSANIPDTTIEIDGQRLGLDEISQGAAEAATRKPRAQVRADLQPRGLDLDEATAQQQEEPEITPEAREAAESVATEETGDQRTASVPTMVTNRMKRDLGNLGYSRDAIKKMKPQEAWDIIQQSQAGTQETDAATDEQAADPELFRRTNGQPFKTERGARASRPFRDALRQEREPIVEPVDGGFAVRVPRPRRMEAPTPSEVEAGASRAETDPSDAQIEADNYRKGRVRLQGMDIAIENPKGSERSGTDEDGGFWRSRLAHHYGDIKGTRAPDGDNVDVFVGDSPDSERAFVIDQVDRDGEFDEPKVMMGFNSAEEARQGYLANYPSNWDGLGAITETDPDTLRQWLEDGDTNRPFGDLDAQAEVAPEPKGIAAQRERDARSTRDRTLYRGSGRQDRGERYAGADVPVMGEGRYFALDRETAEQYGPDIETASQSDVAENPLVIRGDKDWARLTKEAGWDVPNPAGKSEAEIKRLTRQLREEVTGRGHDSIVVDWDDSTPYDMDDSGRSIKLLRDVFDTPQVVSYQAPDQTRYRQTSQPSEHARAVSDAVQPLRDEGLPAEVVDSVDQLPAPIREAIERDGVADQVSGVRHQGTSWLVADNLDSPDEAVRTALHETVGHGGVRQVLGDTMNRTLDAIYRDMPARERRRLERTYAGQLNNQSPEQARRTVAEEHMAHLAETQPQSGWVDRAVSKVRQWLRRLFGDRAAKQWGRQEIVDLLARARGAAITPSRDTAPRYALRFNREFGGFKAHVAPDGTLTVKGDPDEIRAQLPDSVKGRKVKEGLRFTPNLAAQARNALEGFKNAYTRGGEVLRQKPMKNGKYIGAPDKFNTPGKIGKLRRILRGLAEEGAPGRYWYENSGDAILRMVGGDVRRARQFASLLSIYSPQAKVGSNGTFALRAWAQHEAGHPINVKTGDQDRKAERALSDVDEFWSGEKTSNFFNNLLRQIDPSTEGRQGATIDMWMMRAAQYDHDRPTDSEQMFMQDEANRVAKQFGWEPQHVQAAIWVAIKARMENPKVKKRADEISERKGWISFREVEKDGKTRKERVTHNEAKHWDNWFDQAMKSDVDPQETVKAKFDFEEAILNHVGQVSWEARPGRTTGVLPGVHDAPYEQQVEFQQAVHNALRDENGVDMVAARLGLIAEPDDLMAPGAWQGEVSAGMQKQVAVAPDRGGTQRGAVDPAQREALDLYANLLGLLTYQEGIGWHRPFPATSKKRANALDVNVGRPLSAQEMADLSSALDAHFNEKGQPDWQDDLALVSTPQGVRLLNMGTLPDGNALEALDAVFAPAIPDSETKLLRFDGGFAANDWQENPNGQGYTSRISEAGRSDLLDWARDQLQPRVQRVFEDFSERYGWGDPGDVRFSLRSERTGDRGGRQARRGPAPLEGAPSVRGASGPDPELVAVAEQYARDHGIELRRQAEYVKVDEDRARRIADAYAAMEHAPQDPEVQRAYRDMIRQTRAQYDALVDAGYEFYFFDADTDPYDGNPWNAVRDLRANKRMAVFTTEGGFGTDEEFDPTDNPLLEDTGLEWAFGSPDGPKRKVLANDLFRAVHDAFGHGLEGAGFRARGEENAWQAHIRLFTGPAVGAVTSETRGQNSWLNFGPYGEHNRTAGIEDTVFADQKTGLMPEWTWTEGRAPSEDTPEPRFSLAPPVKSPAFRRWFGESVVVDAEGEPLEIYHGTQTDIAYATENGGPIYLTDSARYANYYAGGEATGSPMTFADQYPVGDMTPEQQRDEVERIETEAMATNDAVTEEEAEFYYGEGANLSRMWEAFDDTERQQIRERNPSVADKIDRYQALDARIRETARRQQSLNEEARRVESRGRIATPNVVPVYASIQNPYYVQDEMGIYNLGDDPEAVQRLKDQGYDGAIWINPGVDNLGEAANLPYGSEVLAFSPGQVKSVYNKGEFDIGDPDIRFSLRRPVGGRYPSGDSAHFSLPDETLTEVAARKAVDKMRPLKVLEQRIEEHGGRVNEDNDVYLAEELFHGKTETDLRDLEQDYVQRLAEGLAEADISQSDFDDFLYARHAPERNAKIAERNPDDERYQDGGSGMTDAEAQEILDRKLNSSKADDYRRLAQIVYDMLALRREAIREGGLEDNEAVDAWEASYDYYVPLKGWAHDEEAQPQFGVGTGTGKGFEVQGREGRTALGRRTQAASPSTQAIVDTIQSLIRRRKNEVGNSLLSLVTDNPNPKLWQVFTRDNPDMERAKVTRTDPETGERRIEVQMRPVAMDGNPRYFKTKKGGRTYYIKINDERLANAMRNVGPEQNGLLINAMASATRLMSSLVTSYNPEFMVSNFARDLQTAILNLSAEQTREDGKAKGKRIVRQTVRDIRPAMRAAYRALAGREGRDANSRVWDQWMREFMEDGAKTGYFDMKDIDAQAKELRRVMRRSQRGAVSDMLRARKRATDLVENVNGAVENAVRLSAYVNARKGGLSRKKAASLAKNMTVNFNRRGELGTAFNAAFMFFNASVQGTMNVVRTLGSINDAPPGNSRMNIWSRMNAAQKMAVGMTVGSYMLSMFNRWMSEEDDDDELYWDKVPSFEKERNLVFMTSGENYVKIPLPYGYNVFSVMGTHAEGVINGNKSITDFGKDIALSVLGSFSPIGFEDSPEMQNVLAKNMTPTLFRSITQVAVNEDFAGRPIYRENFVGGAPKPDSQLGMGSTPEAFNAMAEFINEHTGGSKYRSGAVDLNPSVMQHLVNYYGGGAWGFTEKTADAVARVFQGDEIKRFRIPFAGRVMGEVMPYRDMQTFYQRRDELAQLNEEFENIDADKALDFHDKHEAKLGLHELATEVSDTLAKLRDVRDAIKEDDELSEAERKEEVEAIEEAMQAEVDFFNKLYNEDTRESR
ncbi:LPD38 domain-containing protein [Halomonas sp. NO4]|uniref:DUF7178 family protein n=1 Tax=Halomonas sp. NO4 TaxID=2484813 RepID=UPI0013D46153|nr:LPD38 domain-containing protein [Halomonas sp. NO4]